MRISESQRFGLPQVRINQLRTRQIELGEALSSGRRINNRLMTRWVHATQVI